MVNKDDIREAQQSTLRQAIAFTANLTHDSTLIVLNYLLTTSTTASASQIAHETGLSIRSVNRHLARLRDHPHASRMFARTHALNNNIINNNINNNTKNNKSNK